MHRLGAPSAQFFPFGGGGGGAAGGGGGAAGGGGGGGSGGGAGGRVLPPFLERVTTLNESPGVRRPLSRALELCSPPVSSGCRAKVKTYHPANEHGAPKRAKRRFLSKCFVFVRFPVYLQECF